MGISVLSKKALARVDRYSYFLGFWQGVRTVFESNKTKQKQRKYLPVIYAILIFGH